MAELKGKYKEDFNEIRKYIEKTAAKSSEREEALESLSAIYLEAQENQTEISKIHEGTPSEEKETEFCKNCRNKYCFFCYCHGGNFSFA